MKIWERLTLHLELQLLYLSTSHIFLLAMFHPSLSWSFLIPIVYHTRFEPINGHIFAFSAFVSHSQGSPKEEQKENRIC